MLQQTKKEHLICKNKLCIIWTKMCNIPGSGAFLFRSLWLVCLTQVNQIIWPIVQVPADNEGSSQGGDSLCIPVCSCIRRSTKSPSLKRYGFGHYGCDSDVGLVDISLILRMQDRVLPPGASGESWWAISLSASTYAITLGESWRISLGSAASAP